MTLQRYEGTLRGIEEAILERFKEAKPIRGEGNDAQHTLWMIEQVRYQLKDQEEINLWTGWIFAKAHALGCYRFEEILNFARQDIRQVKISRVISSYANTIGLQFESLVSGTWEEVDENSFAIMSYSKVGADDALLIVEFVSNQAARDLTTVKALCKPLD